MSDDVVEKNVQKVPGGYGLPVIGWLRDTIDFFVISGWEAYFRDRQRKYGSSVFKNHMLMKTIAVLDYKSFEPLFNWDGRLEKEYGFGWAKPPPGLVGGVIPSVFAAGSAHSAPKTFYMQLLKARAATLSANFASTSAEYFERWERVAPFRWSDEIERFYATFFFQWFLGARPDPEDVRTVNNDLFGHLFWRLTRFLPWSKYSRSVEAYARLLAVVKGSPGFEDIMRIARTCGLQSEDEVAKQLLFTIGVNCYLGLQCLSKSLIGELSMRPKLRAEMRAEALAVLGSAAQIDLGGLSKLPLLDGFVKETLRLHPPVFFIFGRATRDFVLDTAAGRFQIESGEMLMGVIPIAQLDPDAYVDPGTFRPGRFSDPAAEDALVWPHGTQEGPILVESRICAGRDVGMLLAKLFCATLLRSYDWDLQNPDLRWDDKSFSLDVAAPIGSLEVSRFARST